MLPTIFRGARATGRVYFINGGVYKDKGLAYSGFVGPFTTVAVAPTIEQIVPFSIPAKSSDQQDVTVSGSIKVVLTPQVAVQKFDLTVDPRSGSYLARWESALADLVSEETLTPVRAEAAKLDIEGIVSAENKFEAAILAHFEARTQALAEKGIQFRSVSVSSSLPDDEDVTESIGVEEREKLLAAADNARHERQMNASQNARKVQTYDAETKLKLEEGRATLIAEQNKNKKTEAEGDAVAIIERLKPFVDMDAGKMLGVSINEMAKGGRVGTLVISPDILAALDKK